MPLTKERHSKKNFIDKLLQPFSSHSRTDETKISSLNHPSFFESDDGSTVTQSFSRLSLSSGPSSVPLAKSQFIGGFHPGLGLHPPPIKARLPNPNDTSESSTSVMFSSPPMPIPYVANSTGRQSLTMQMALKSGSIPLTPPSLPARPYSAPMLPSPSTSANSSVSFAAPTNVSSNSLPSKRGATKESARAIRCAGITKSGEQCTRTVKIGPPLAQILGNGDDGAEVTRFCFQHKKEVLMSSGFYALKNGLWVETAEWIPSYLQSDTQAALLAEMKKAGSSSDILGYIYTYEIREPKTNTVKLKVGRTTNIVRRLDQWGKQCGSKEPIPRGFYPGSIEYESGSLIKGMVKPGQKTPWIHRLERLIHLELADLAASCIYLDPNWPKIGLSPESSSTGLTSPSKKITSSTSTKPKGRMLMPHACSDCGKIHQEIFEFVRWKDGNSNAGKEWELIVRPVIERWGQFVNRYL